MNTQEYIESGILEAYVIDALTPEERLEVEANIAKYPELAAEVRAIEDGLLALAKAGAQEPPGHLKEKIWNAIVNETAPLTGNQKTAETPKATYPFTPVHSSSFDWKRAALWIGLAVSLGANYLLWSRSASMQDQQVVMAERMDSLNTERYALQKVAENARKENEMLADTAMQAVVMKTMLPANPMAATVYWDKAKGEIYLTVQKMPAPPPGKQYQMWVIQNGAPVSMGVIPDDVVTSGMITKLPMQITDGQAFAISLEKEGGNPTPTEVQVLGKPS